MSTVAAKWRRARKTAVLIPIVRMLGAANGSAHSTQSLLASHQRYCAPDEGSPLPFPYIPQAIQFAVLANVLVLFSCLFITTGVISQVAGVFRASFLRLGALITTALLLSIIYAITLYSSDILQFLHSFQRCGSQQRLQVRLLA